MDAKLENDVNVLKKRFSFNLSTGAKLPGNEAEVSSGSADRLLLKSPSPTQLTDDFLTIVPKPTLLSKENAKRRLQAFGSTKYLAIKKPKLIEHEKKSGEEATTMQNNISAEKKCAKLEIQVANATNNDATNTMEKNKGYKEELCELKVIVKHGHKGRRMSASRDNGFMRGGRTNRKRSSLNLERRNAKYDKRIESYFKERTGWDDYDDDFAYHPNCNDVSSLLFDYRRMLLFNPINNLIRPYEYKKVDGSVTSILSHHLRYTSKATPRITFSPNPKTFTDRYIGRAEYFTVVTKQQKACFMELLDQAKRGKPLLPHKSLSSREWYYANYLHAKNADDVTDNGEVKCKAENEVHNSEKSQSAKRKRKKDRRREKEAGDTKARSKSSKSKREKSVSKHMTDKCTDLPNAAADSKNSEETLSNNLALPLLLDIEKTNIVKDDVVVNSLNNGELPKSGESAAAETLLNAELTAATIYTTEEGTDQVELTELTVRHTFTGSGNGISKSHMTHASEPDLRTYSIKQPTATATCLSTLLASRIYNIGNDSIDTVSKTFEPPIIDELNIQLQPDVPIAINRLEPQVVTEEKNGTQDHEVIADVGACEVHAKEMVMEKLKTKPSELYSPTLQSSNSVSSAETGTPNTNEYRSHWESEDEIPHAKMDTSWESEDEIYPVVLERDYEKPLIERSLEMPLNISISRSRASLILPERTPDLIASFLFEDLDGANSWDTSRKLLHHHSFDIGKNMEHETLPMIDKPSLEDEYLQFMSSVSTLEDQRKRRYSTTSTSSSSSSASSSSSSSSSSNEEDLKAKKREKAATKKHGKQNNSKNLLENAHLSPVCKVDSTSSPATLPLNENKLEMTPRKPLTGIVITKKSPLLGCSLFKDEDTDEESQQSVTKPEVVILKKDSPSQHKRIMSPRRGRNGSSPRRRSSPAVKRYSPKRNRRERSPRRRDSPRKDISPKPRDNHESSPHREGTRRITSPKQRDSSPRRDRKASPKHRDMSPRRRSPKHIEDSRSPRHRSPRATTDLPRTGREHHRDRHRSDVDNSRHRDRKYRDDSPRFSPSRHSPCRRRSPPRHRYSPRFRDRSPRRRSKSPVRRVYSRSRSKDRKHESITQTLHRLAGIDYEPPKSPPGVNSPIDSYIRGVADSTISDEQLLQNRIAGMGIPSTTEYCATTQSPVYFHSQFKLPDGTAPPSPKRIPLDDRINQVLGIDAAKPIPYPPLENQYYNNPLYYEQYGTLNAAPPVPNHSGPFDHSNRFKHYNRHLVDVTMTASPKVVQVGNVLQVVPVEQQQPNLAGKKQTVSDAVVNILPKINAPNQKFVPVGNMLQIVPTTELPPSNEEITLIEQQLPVTNHIEVTKTKFDEDIQQLKVAERKVERERRRLERERRRKEKEDKRKEREKRRLLKMKLRSEEMIKKALNFDMNEDVEYAETKLPSVSIYSTPSKISKSILVQRKDPMFNTDVKLIKQKKGVKFADGVLPGEGTSPSGGEELASPPPCTKLSKEKRYTKTKKAKHHKKKQKAKRLRKQKKRKLDDEANLPPPSPPPGSPPPHLFPPRLKMTVFSPSYYLGYPFNAVNCQPMGEPTLHPPPFQSALPPIQFPMHMQSAPVLHPLPVPHVQIPRALHKVQKP